jgi:RHS repeat-associated protein
VASIQSSNTHGANVSYTYDDLDRLDTVVDHRLSGNNTTTYSYDPASNVATAAYPNGLQSSFTYDALNRLTAMNAGTASYSYQLGPTGNRTQASESNGRTINWTYDGIYRLTNESITSDPHSVDGSVAYGLDPVGNRLTESSSIAGVNSGSYGYNADDEVSTESYDLNGNTLTTGGKTFTYDAENHLTGMSVSGTTVSIVYDAFGNRVSKTVNGVTTKYLVEDDVNPTGYPQVLDELTSGVVTRTYTYGLQRISQDQLISGVWSPSFYGYDGGGNVRQLTNSAGTVTDTYEYDAFGNDVYHTGTTPNNYLYRGEQYDSDLGLYYLRARYYNPLTGRFLSRDPGKSRTAAPDATRKDLNSDANQEVSFYLFGGPASTPVSSSTQGCLSSSLSDEDIRVPQSQHKYNYANSDPINRIDPSGRDSLIEFSLEDSEIDAAEEKGEEAGRCAVVKNLCWSGCFLAVTSAGIHGADTFGDTRACTRRCMAAAGCFNY